MRDVWYLAQCFVLREWAHEILHQRLDMADLEAHLAYKPWVSKERNQTYPQAIEEERIPRIQDRDKAVRAAAGIGEETGSVLNFMSMLWSISLLPKYPELLHTQQMALLREGAIRHDVEQIITGTIGLDDLWVRMAP